MTMRPFLLATAAALLAACGPASAPTAKAYAEVASEPPLETDPALLDAALVCTPFTHPDRNPVLLVHGTFTNGNEQYDWTYLPLLDQRGFDVCAVTYPDRGLNDQQVSAEYVVYALRKVHAESGRKVEMIGHSQGAGMPRWSLRWWPSAREAVEDFVLQAGPVHGTVVADPSGGYAANNPVGMPAAFYQFSPESQFTALVNSCDETPGNIDYTSLYTQFDELVEPSAPVPTAALEWGHANPRVTNLLLQDLCPGRLVDHVTIGTTDRLAFELTLDAISHKGPLDVERAGGAALCGMANFVPDQLIVSDAVQRMLAILPKDQAQGFPQATPVTSEPAPKAYAVPDCGKQGL